MNKKSGTNEIMYNLCIDQGNSSTKIGIFKQDVLLESHVYEIFGVTRFRIISGIPLIVVFCQVKLP